MFYIAVKQSSNAFQVVQRQKEKILATMSKQKKRERKEKERNGIRYKLNGLWQNG